MEQDETSGFFFDHARYLGNGTAAGRFLSADRVSGRQWDPQTWNRYTYARNNPLKFVDRTGLDFVLSGCANNDNFQCQYQKTRLQNAVGKNASQYLEFGKGGLVTLMGITAREFGKFNTVAAGLGRLIANRAASFSLVTDNPREANRGNSGGARFAESKVGSGGTIYLDPSQFPKMLGGVRGDATEVFAHEMGHAVGTLYQGIRDAIDKMSVRSAFAEGEGYATAFENEYRVQVVGVDKNDIRWFYNVPGDLLVAAPGTPLLPE